MPAGYQFAFDPIAAAGGAPTGFGTPSSDRTPQVCYVPPKRVIPIVFLPGIMGSNLRITSPERIDTLRRKDADKDSNIAWRPDIYGIGNAYSKSNVTPAERQLLLDPKTTVIDAYNPASTDPRLDGDERNKNVDLSMRFSSPLLAADPPGSSNARTAHQKARARGWGEVYFDSYGKLLQHVESRMQKVFQGGRLAEGWDEVIGIDPKRWGLDPATPRQALTLEELRAITKETFFPVHAIGYNWLLSNRKNATEVADRIRTLVRSYRTGSSCAHDCPGVIVVTHSMGGLLGRALIHPDMGGLQDLVLGIVHGVQPATGAAAAYRRIRAGFEDPQLRHPLDSVGAKIAGNYGDEVTAVLANSPGGLQLLPSKAYGNGWLRVQSGDRELMSLPAKGDPYEEIYKIRGKWYGLVADEAWLNPAHLTFDDAATAIEHTHRCIDVAAEFHRVLGDTYHENTYLHFGADRGNMAFGKVTWRFNRTDVRASEWKGWKVVRDNRQGAVRFSEDRIDESSANAELVDIVAGLIAVIDPQDEPGDQTVPVRSAEHPARLGKCKAVFRQTGYDHQGSYKNEAVLAATLYSILRIAQRVQLP